MRPYASWWRNSKERQYIPNKPRLIRSRLIRLHSPRIESVIVKKSLGFKTPYEVLMKQINSCHNAIALQT